MSFNAVSLSAPSAPHGMVAPNERAQPSDLGLRLALLGVLLSATVFQRFGLNLGSYSVNVALVAMYGLLLVATWKGRLELSADRALLLALCVSFATLSLLLNTSVASGAKASLWSLLLLAAIYLPFVFVLRPGSLGPDDTDWVLRSFSTLSLVCALAGITQFYAQFFVRPEWLFDFTPFLPEMLRGPSGYNTVIPVGSLYKSNGFFFREPSHFSLAMALALLLELALYRRPLRVVCFGLALLLTYSGTGLLALLTGLMFPLGLKTVARLAAVALAGALAFLLLGDTLGLSFTLSRIGEFGSEHSSAYIRYIAPARLLNETVETEVWTFWLGHGPGTILRTSQGFVFHDPTWAKLWFEYGAFGFVSFVALYLVALRRPRVPVQLRAALFLSWLIMGGHLLAPENNYLTLVLAGLLPPLLTSSKETPRPVKHVP
jgi:hypothetical protein